MAASFVANDNNPPPVFYSDPKNERLPLDQEQVAEKCGPKIASLVAFW
jgi:hypothetical protein